jgi:hypothetical protein
VQIAELEFRYFYFPDGFLLLYTKPFHQPPVLLRIYLLHFVSGPWPLKSAICQPFIQQQKSIAFVNQSLDPVCTPSAEQKYTAFFAGIQMEAAFHR